MIDRLRTLWRTNRLALIAFIGVLVVIGYFAIQTITSTIYWMDPKHQDHRIKPWMTPRYISQSYKLPQFVVGPTLFLEKDAPPRRVSLAEIANQNNLTLDQLQDRIDQAAAAWRADPNRDNWVSK